MDWNSSPDPRSITNGQARNTFDSIEQGGKEDVVTSCCSQFSVLIRRKELLLKRNRCCTTFWELALPAMLCSMLIIGALTSTRDTYPDTSYAPDSMFVALSSLGPLGFATFLSQQAGSSFVPAGLPGLPSPKTPTAIPPLSLFLGYSYLSQLTASNEGFPLSFPPFDGTYLAVTPNTTEVRALVEDVLTRPVEPWMLDTSGVLGFQIDSYLQQSTSFHNVTSFPEPAALRSLYEVRYFDDEAAIERAAKDEAAIWAALVVKRTPAADSSLGYALRFNATALPPQQRPFDRFPSGLSTEFWPYYSSGFLSLQSALNQHVLLANTAEPTLPPPLAVGIPFPIEAFTHNTFFNFAGNLIGLVVVFSFLIPISTMLRALVLEKESKLREQLLTMGATLPAYYGSVLATYGTSFFITAIICAMIIGFSCYQYSAWSLVLVLFILFALASLAFTLALSPFFTNARLAALVGPLLFFITSQFYNLFLDGGELVEGNEVSSMRPPSISNLSWILRRISPPRRRLFLSCPLPLSPALPLLPASPSLTSSTALTSSALWPAPAHTHRAASSPSPSSPRWPSTWARL